MAESYNTIRISGAMPGGEVWSVNPKYQLSGGTGLSEFDALNEWVQAIALLNNGNVAPDTLLGLLSTAASITSIRAEYYETDGKLANVAERVLPSPVVGAGNANKPYQVSMVCSILTGRPGRSFRGRIYWPALNVSMDVNTLRVPAGNLTTYATGFAQLLQQIGDTEPSGAAPRLAVVSQTLGLGTEATSIQVGNVLDIQRRRRDSLTESYESVVLAAP